jgi:ribosomal protein S1
MFNIEATGLIVSLFPKVSGFERISSISWESLSVSVEFAFR